MTDKPVTLAAIIGAHGVAGEVRLKLFGEGAEALKSYKSFDAAGRVLTLKSVRPGPKRSLVVGGGLPPPVAGRDACGRGTRPDFTGIALRDHTAGERLRS